MSLYLPGHDLDVVCERSTHAKRHNVVAWILMTAYMRHVHDIPFVSDAAYETLLTHAYKWWEYLEHPHKYLITLTDILRGDLSHWAEEDYPNMIKHSACRLCSEHLDITVDFIHGTQYRLVAERIHALA